jgi:S-adenosylmethionine decarboxylase
MKNTHSLGKHLVLDAFVEHPENFTKSKLKKILKILADTLKMQIIGGPEVYEVALDPSKLSGDSFLDEGGTTATCVISTSHIAIHTWPIRKFVSIDIFSCKEFNVEEALEILHMTFGLTNYKATVIDRICPKDLNDTINHVIKNLEL